MITQILFRCINIVQDTLPTTFVTKLGGYPDNEVSHRQLWGEQPVREGQL